MAQNVDWSVIALPGVEEVATKAASRVGSDFAGITEAGDMKQEIYIWMATHPDAVQDYVERDQLGLLYKRLTSRAHHAIEKQAHHSNRTISITRLADDI